MADGLFDFEDPPKQSEGVPQSLMTARQRETIRDLFATLGVTDARSQFDLVSELTGVRITSVGQLEMGDANTLMRMLTARVTSAGRQNTGNAWADRDEDTWIDQL